MSILIIALAVLGAVALPVFPSLQTASAELRPVAAESTARLLGENSPELRTPPDGERRGGSGGAGIMTLTVPRLGLEDVPVPTGSSQAELDREGILHLETSGVPWREYSNTFIVGHALGFAHTRVPYAFYELDRIEPGDRIIIRHPDGEEYVFRVYDLMTVRPSDYWVTHPVDGKTTVSLQTCTPIPSFEKRLIVRGEIVG